MPEELGPLVPEWLQRYLVLGTYDPTTGEQHGFCPRHDDNKRSASYNHLKQLYYCFGECLPPSMRYDQLKDWLETHEAFDVPQGRVVDLNRERAVRRANDAPPSVTLAHVRGWHSRLMASKEPLWHLTRDRGFTRPTIESRLIGLDEDSVYTIPILSADRTELYNVRRYRPARGKKRSGYWSIGGWGTNRLWPEENLLLRSSPNDDRPLLLCEGEWDTLLAIQGGFRAITTTAGAKNWDDSWNELFKGEVVYICYDADKVGERSAQSVAIKLTPYARGIYIVRLPYTGEHGSNDITDFFVKDGHPPEDLQALLDKAAVHKDPSEYIGEQEIVEVTVDESFNPELHGKTIEMKVSVVGKHELPVLAPKVVTLTCPMTAGPQCNHCPMMVQHNGYYQMTVDKKDERLLEIVGASKKETLEVLRNIAGAKQCKLLSGETVEQYTIERLYVKQNIDDTDVYARGCGQRRVYAVGPYKTPAGASLLLRGTQVPSPRDRYAEFLSWDNTEVASSLESFELTPEIREQLKIFQSDTPLKKCWEVAEDLADNVTRIYGRTELHVAMDLVFHSVLRYKFAGELIRKGWLELLVIGDTRTGKSAAAEAMCRHYGLGKIISCESASYAGIVGGLQPLGGREWMVTWGALPTNDRRLVVLDEISGLSTEQISQMSGVRSSGEAQLSKVKQDTAPARTRLIWMGNPRDGRLGESTYAIRKISGLIGNDEDIARFDFAMSVSSGEVTSDTINRYERQLVPHKYDSEACRNLILWAWTRHVDQVEWTRSAEELCYSLAIMVGQNYCPTPPLVQPENIRVKLARLSTAIAARVFSSSPDGERLIVKPEHVKAAMRFLNRLYSNRLFGYASWSAQDRANTLRGVDNEMSLKQRVESDPLLVRFLRQYDTFSPQTLQITLHLTPEGASAVISDLWNLGALDIRDDRYHLKPILSQILREIGNV